MVSVGVDSLDEHSIIMKEHGCCKRVVAVTKFFLDGSKCLTHIIQGVHEKDSEKKELDN